MKIFKKKPSQIYAERYLPPTFIPEQIIIPTSKSEIPDSELYALDCVLHDIDYYKHAYYQHPNGRKLRINKGDWFVTEDFKNYWIASNEFIKKYYDEQDSNLKDDTEMPLRLILVLSEGDVNGCCYVVTHELDEYSNAAPHLICKSNSTGKVASVLFTSHAEFDRFKKNEKLCEAKITDEDGYVFDVKINKDRYDEVPVE